MKTFTFLLLLFSNICISSSIIASQFKDDSIRHTCETNQECADRLNPIYPPYSFVCCTTVSCNDNYSKHYTVTSGCTPSPTCTLNITVNDGTFFATTMEKESWEKFDSSLIGSCDLTRQIIGGLPPMTTVVTEEPKKEITTLAPTSEVTF